MWEGLCYSLIAGATIPLGGFLASLESLLPSWGRNELHHSVIAFGGGALFSAVALVLVPEGTEKVSIGLALISFLTGGAFFCLLDSVLARIGGAGSQLVAMMSDFIPEAIALGAAMTAGKSSAVLIAVMIGLQNLPEGFNAYRELTHQGGLPARRVLMVFSLLSLLGPLAAYLGFTFFADQESWLGCLMLFAGGGILYLTFEDIAPQAVLENQRWPALGSIAGFALGLLGSLLTG